MPHWSPWPLPTSTKQRSCSNDHTYVLNDTGRMRLSNTRMMPYLHLADCLFLCSSDFICFYCASYASAVLGVVILSVCHTRALWLIQRTYRRYFDTTWKGNPSSQMWFFVQLCSSWQDFDWLKGSRGLSAAAELLVQYSCCFFNHEFINKENYAT